MKKTKEYRVEIDVYYAHGLMYGTHLEAPTKAKLKLLIDDFIKKYSHKEIEVIRIYSGRIVVTSPVKDFNIEHKLVNKVKNAYIKHQYK